MKWFGKFVFSRKNRKPSAREIQLGPVERSDFAPDRGDELAHGKQQQRPGQGRADPMSLDFKRGGNGLVSVVRFRFHLVVSVGVADVNSEPYERDKFRFVRTL